MSRNQGIQQLVDDVMPCDGILSNRMRLARGLLFDRGSLLQEGGLQWQNRVSIHAANSSFIDYCTVQPACYESIAYCP